jgi:hypothetical protein
MLLASHSRPAMLISLGASTLYPPTAAPAAQVIV